MGKIPVNYFERLYAGWLGKLIGVRYGAPIEGWSYEKIKNVFGELDGYVVDYKDFAADDDSNGPMFFLRALQDYGLDASAKEIGLTWLNYTPYEHGMFWWGGYGVSTEHTAYLNLRNGIHAPRSGSVEQNGPDVAEQIGGQIFIDTWGLVTPGQPDKAAEYARRAASVSHGGNAINGGVFVAAAISLAFVETDIYTIVDKALTYVPSDSEYMRMAKDVISYYKSNPADWRNTFRLVQENYGYDRYPGYCHVIPNSAVIILSLLHGEGDFDKSLNICNMCGWDTDCNVANAGCIVGTLAGLEGINYEKWRKPMHDMLVCSSSLGSLNNLDIPWCAAYIAGLAYKIAGETPSEEWQDIISEKAARFHFDLPGSTHSFRIKTSRPENNVLYLRQTTEHAHSGKGSLYFYSNGMEISEEAFIYHKTYYRPDDFHDSRYDPSFSPILYPGQTISCHVLSPKHLKGRLEAALYVKDDYANDNKYIRSEAVILNDDGWTELNFQIPSGKGKLISEAGVVVKLLGNENWGSDVGLYIDDFNFTGHADYGIDFSLETRDKWGYRIREVSQFTYIKGIWTLENGELSGSCSDFGETYTGGHNFTDYSFTATMIPKLGGVHQINFRVEGAIRSYAAALMSGNRLVLLKNTNGYEELASAAFEWHPECEYTLKVVAEGNRLRVFTTESSEPLIDYTDNNNPYLKGAVGASVYSGSHCHYKDFYVRCYNSGK